MATIVAGRDPRELKLPHRPASFLDAMRGPLPMGASKPSTSKVDPNARGGNPPRKKGLGFRMWTEDEMAALRETVAARHAPAQSGSTYWPTRAFGVAMWCDSGASTSATV